MTETTPQSAPAVVPDSMNQPGTAAAPVMESVAPPNLTQGNLPAYGEAGAPEQPSTVVPAGQATAPAAKPAKHQVLAAMVQGLSDALAGFSAGMASKGKISGAEVVQGLEAQRQQARQSASAEARAQQDADLRNKLTTAQTNQVLTQTHLLNASLQDEMSLKHTQAQEAGLGLQKQAQAIFNEQGQVPTGWQVDPNTWQLTQVQPGAAQATAAAVGTNPPTTAPVGAAPLGTPAPAQRRASILLDAYGKELQDEKGNDDPLVTQARQIINDPNAPPAQKQQALIAVQQKSGLNAQVIKNLTEKADLKVKQEAGETGGVVGKLSTPEALAAPGAQAAIQAQIDNPNNSAKEVAQLRALLPQAAVAQLNAANIKAREQRNQQIVNQGDPADAGRLLADRSLTLEELKSRNVTPAFIDASVAAAQKIDPNFKAPEAAAQSRIAASPANSQFFGNTDSLLVRGGTLDQLAQAHAALGNTKLPFANKLENWTKAAVGSGPQAAFAASGLGVADDYSKVISGGAGSDSSRQQALDIIGRDLSPEGMAASLKQIRSTITSQRNGRISTNPYLAHMYPDPSTRQETAGVAGTQPAAPRTPPAGVPVGSKLMQVPGGQPHWMSPDKIAAAQKLGATEVQ